MWLVLLLCLAIQCNFVCAVFDLCDITWLNKGYITFIGYISARHIQTDKYVYSSPQEVFQEIHSTPRSSRVPVMTLMILPLGKNQWWWGHFSTSIMRSVCWGNVLHARQWAGVDETCCTIHVTICSLSESLAPQACGLWNQAVGWSNSSSSSWSHWANMWFRPASNAALTVLVSVIVPCAIQISSRAPGQMESTEIERAIASSREVT